MNIQFNIRYSKPSSSKRSVFFRFSDRSQTGLCIYLVPCVPRPEPILYFFIYSSQEYLTKSTIHEAHHCTLIQLSVTSTYFGPNIFLSTIDILFCNPFLLTYLLTPWTRVLLEKLTGSAASQEIPPHFMEPEGSLPHSQEIGRAHV